jgi:hypothetical protein
VNAAPGRSCPLHYRYGAAAIARAPERAVDTLYVIGGLYGNRPALDAVEALARAESASGGTATLCFNGDFNWFDVDDRAFTEINTRVLAHDAILGNVEAEFDAASDDAGCGCAYPESVDAGTVERSNAIHRRLKATAARHPALRERITRLPMLARYRVGACRVGVVHGDADSLAGWRFDVAALDDPQAVTWLREVFGAAAVDVFASTHTCLPALRKVALRDGDPRTRGCVVNNGAAGMPNFGGDLRGLVTRIARTPATGAVLHETVVAGAHVALVPLAFDHTRWVAEFTAQWPPGSAAQTSYFQRITQGPAYTPAQAHAAPG